MELVVVLLLRLLALTGLSAAPWEPAAAFDEERSIEMAQCRADCLYKTTSAHEWRNRRSCLLQKSCSKCWSRCEVIIHKSACKFSKNQPKPDGLMCRFLRKKKFKEQSLLLGKENWNPEIEIVGSVLRWNRFDAQHPTVVVYSLYYLDSKKVWRFFQQTDALFVPVADVVSECLRILAITHSGVISSSEVCSLRERNTNDKHLHDVQQATQKEPVDHHSDLAASRVQNQSTWSLRLDALESSRDGNSVTARISWKPTNVLAKPSYLVTWEVAEDVFNIKGHLVTDISNVTLCFWPNSTYRVQVTEVDPASNLSLSSSSSLWIKTYFPSPKALHFASPESRQGKNYAEGITDFARYLYPAFVIFLVFLLICRIQKKELTVSRTFLVSENPKVSQPDFWKRVKETKVVVSAASQGAPEKSAKVFDTSAAAVPVS